jgi:hypothetical protein
MNSMLTNENNITVDVSRIGLQTKTLGNNRVTAFDDDAPSQLINKGTINKEKLDSSN